LSLETLANTFEFFLSLVPIIVLAVGVSLYFLLKTHRKTLSIVIITLGVVGLCFFSFWFYFAATLSLSLTENMIVFFVVEVLTLLFGLIIYKNRLKEEQ